MTGTVTLTGEGLTIANVVAVARSGARVAIASEATARTNRARQAIERVLAGEAPVYGVNTGFGKLATVRIGRADLGALQRNLILSHCAGVGDPLPADVVRAMMLLRANVLLRDTSGVRPVLPQRLADLLNAGIHPVVPEQGSVGASGDLAPLSHVALALLGEGDVHVRGRRLPAREALRDQNIEPLVLEAKEGIAFINGTQAQAAVLALLVHDAWNLWRTSLGAAAMSVEALMGTPTPFERRVQEVRPHAGQLEAAEVLLGLLEDSEIRESHRENDPRVQDAYSLRCTPQVLGAVYEAIAFADRIAQVELNASTDNPLVFGDEIVSGGNFHGQPVALALDVLGIGLTTLSGIAERRVERLVNPDLSHGLPPFLAAQAGLHSGLMMVQVTAAALAAESRTLAAPGSVHSIPTGAGQEDFVPMGMASAWKARRILANAQRVVACELLAAAEGLEFRRPLRPGRGVARLYDRVRTVAPRLDGDRPLTPDLEGLARLVALEALV